MFDAPNSTLFQLTHLLRGATMLFSRFPPATAFQLTHLLRGATRSSSAFVLAFKFQLTHLLRGATWAEFVREDGENNFNSRTSCEVRLAPENSAEKAINFNSRTSCEVRHISLEISTRIKIISTHAPLARCDDLMRFAGLMGQNFNSRTSCEVRRWNMGITYSESISTHAPLARCD